MRLSKIKLAGFKSFVDATQIHLPGQIVGVVGPNGCGKSNVIDALRWVLGESRASALRGESMQDVIFNGSGKRKPVSRASVELVFDNSLGKAGGQWASYAEICIGRVLQRNGESTYLINNQKVRRRDITDIFLGTGLGARAYAIVEQGMISRIIDARPEELRVFLEEAAGVSKYRDRRRETSLRLADTRDNLLRVADILQEMESRLVYLAEQAQVARQYRELETQRDTAQQLLWLLKKQEAATLRDGFAATTEKTRTELEAQTAASRSIESRLEMLRSSHFELSDALHERQGELYSVNAQIAGLEQQIRHAEQQQQRLSQQIDHAALQSEQQQQRHREAITALEHWQQQWAEAGFRIEASEQNAAREGESLPLAEEAARNAQQRYNELQREHLTLQQQLQLGQSQHENLLRNVRQLESRRTRLQLEQDNLQRPDNEALQQMQQESAELDMAHQASGDVLADLQAQLPQLDRERQRFRESLHREERQAAQTGARLHALQQLQVGNDQNLDTWLSQQRLNDRPRLWQSIRIADGWECALEAVLRERINAVQADAAVISTVPPLRLALFDGAQSVGAARAENAGSLIPLLDYVQFQDVQARPAMCEWLAFIYAAADMSAALALREQLPEGGWFVTPDGHLIGLHSVLFYAPDGQLHGVLTRQREIEQLKHEFAVKHQMIDALKCQLDETERRYLSVDVQVLPLQRAINEMKLRQHALQMDILKLDQAHERSRERALQIAHEMQEVMALLLTEQKQQQDVVEQMDRLHQQIAVFYEQVDEAQRHAQAQEMYLREQREHVQRAQHELQEANFFMRSCTDKIADLKANIQRLADGMLQTEQNLAQLRCELSGIAEAVVAPALQEALLVRHDAEQALAEARLNLEAAAGELQNLEQQRMSCEHQLNGLRERLGELALKEQEARLHFEQWDGQLQGADESALLTMLVGAKASQLQSEYNRLNRSIEALGAVNLAALEELQAATERKVYLDAQAQDLQAAMATLTDAIRHIDRESRDLLMDTFNRVNEHLSELFPVLFAGGEARLILTGEEILDSGVQVMAQPPGKKNSSIHLLSGGEKALTAIALIFSLFQLNPAPFCLLDEVDAPLDDTNTERLCALVRKMAVHTQFVFISHNKIAMEMAHQLIGVTMQEKGVSKVVSVDIEAALRMRDEDT